MKKLKMVFMGTPDIAEPCLELLHNHPLIEIHKVISMPDRPAGRGHNLCSPPVAELAKKFKLPLFQTENVNKEEELLQELEAAEIDFILVFAFAQFLSERVINIGKLGSFNIHTSLLPRYRGAAPIQYALMNGDKETGVTVQRIVKKMDAGDVALCLKTPIEDFETGGLLYTKLKFLAPSALTELINQIVNDKLEFKGQDESCVCFAPTLKKEDGFLNFEKETCCQIINKIRGLQPWPGSYCFLNGKRLKVFAAEPVNTQTTPGSVNTKHGTLIIGTQDRSLRLTLVQLEGKKQGTDTELLNGIREDIIINGDQK